MSITESALRDQIAIEAMKVILAHHKFTPGKEPEDVEMVAEAAYIMADAMLKERQVIR